jgi:hypothetical protein
VIYLLYNTAVLSPSSTLDSDQSRSFGASAVTRVAMGWGSGKIASPSLTKAYLFDYSIIPRDWISCYSARREPGTSAIDDSSVSPPLESLARTYLSEQSDIVGGFPVTWLGLSRLAIES